MAFETQTGVFGVNKQKFPRKLTEFIRRQPLVFMGIVTGGAFHKAVHISFSIKNKVRRQDRVNFRIRQGIIIGKGKRVVSRKIQIGANAGRAAGRDLIYHGDPSRRLQHCPQGYRAVVTAKAKSRRTVWL